MTGRGTRRMVVLVIVGLGLGLVLRAEERAVDLRIGQPMPNFTLRKGDGSDLSLFDFAGKKAAVLCFLGTKCPNANVSIPRLIELARAYEPKNVVFLAIYSNAGESADEVAAHAKDHGLTFPALKDPGNKVADLAQVERTPEVVVLDGRAAVRYRGAIDDQYGLGERKTSPTKNFLSDALDAIVTGRKVAEPSTEVLGCPIERVEKKPSGTKLARVRPAPEAIVSGFANEKPVEVGQVTYAADVAPIVATKCQECHRAGQVGPFPLMTYDDVRRRSAGIAEVVEDRRMPPWHADPKFGHFANDRSLSAKQRATLLAWVEQGSPLGDPAKLPEPRKFADSWTIGKPDVVLEIPKAFDIPAQGVLPYQMVEVAMNFDKEVWVQSAEVMPTAKEVVHHVIAFIMTEENGRRARPEHFAAYVPGDTPTKYPDGIAKKIPAGSKLLFQIHYTPDGTPRTDRTKLGLIFAKAPVEHRARTIWIEDKRFRIPPGADDYPVTSTHTTQANVHLFSLSPHMHLRGKDFKYTLTYPDGKSEVILSVPAYDFGWQSAYVLSEPKALPKGTRIDCVAHFDNSTKNPSNPDATKEVRWGEQSFQEMMMGYLDYVEDAPGDPKR